MSPIGRFAPSTTGDAHPGTLLSALLVWLDMRSRQGQAHLRLEDIDPQRCKPEFADALLDALQWMGLEWDVTDYQSEFTSRHEQALDTLAEQGLLYPCALSRRDIQAHGTQRPDGTWAYKNSSRGRKLPPGGWRACNENIRVRLPDGVVDVQGVAGDDLSADVSGTIGDPIVRRRDGAIAYHLAVVVDDAASDVTDIVRGRDLASSTPTQAALYDLLGYPRPTWRHHFLLLQPQGEKLAKMHRAVGAETLKRHYTPTEFCGHLAYWAGLLEEPTPTSPQDLQGGFGWDRVHRQDRVLTEIDGRYALLDTSTQ